MVGRTVKLRESTYKALVNLQIEIESRGLARVTRDGKPVFKRAPSKADLIDAALKIFTGALDEW